MILTTVLFAMALSLDSLGVGISYGLDNMKISRGALLIICCCSAGVLATAMFIGQLLMQVIDLSLVRFLGAGILLSLGSFSLIKSIIKMLQNKEGTLFELTISSLGIVIQIFKEPNKVDMDRSGVISGTEALLLGLALSLDSFGAGIGAALLGLKIISTSLCVGISAFLFVSLGMSIGSRLGERNSYNKLSLLPGSILILIGLSRLLF